MAGPTALANSTRCCGATALLPERQAAALYGPPSHGKFWVQTAALWERLGRRFETRLVAGALLMEASKQLYARPPSGAKVAVPGPLDMLEGLAGAKPEPVAGHMSSAGEVRLGVHHGRFTVKIPIVR